MGRGIFLLLFAYAASAQEAASHAGKWIGVPHFRILAGILG